METSHSTTQPLLLLLHDMNKAFDFTQWWVIEKTFSRFAIPPKFQSFLLNYVKKSKHLSTKFGPTKLIQLQNSVKQGDPLSGYLYILTLDLLHEMCEKSSNFSLTKPGFQWNDSHTASIGFSDDFSNPSDSIPGAKGLTKLATTYTKLQSTFLRGDKTNFLGINLSQQICDELARSPIIINNIPIPILKSSEPARFLGLQIRADLSPNSQISQLKQQMYAIISKFWTKSLSFKEIVYVYQDILISTFSFSSKFFHVPNSILESLDKDIFNSLKSLDPNPFSGQHKIGTYASLGILPFLTHNKIISIAEVFVALTENSPQ
jgi:hypothetical protein